MNTTSTTDFRSLAYDQLCSELAELDTKRKNLTSTIAGLATHLNLDSHTARRKKRAAGPASTVDVPTELASLDTAHRIMYVMNGAPARRWELNALTKAVHVASTNSVNTALRRMADRGQTVQHPDKTWTLHHDNGSNT